ncbi:Beta-glucuronidase [Fulvia fulva]|uniref:Beta-glucuronidase n=1 Tax=Passalora fulva TaxID=5499 RepID=A0A9Q8LCX2_PASFU|nr:Beta-glucuronidase [Fulvia fulva]KAK4628873.1 Beta-glucuronidase [Fulvia fulva]KAK4630617.1 Beta-glucuronidase [Fulvia fulva]UJO14919.1 Beta-glucuronidase [Fulvia fulva]WPV12367.1 Beta-glucuronidase [Fulvia fulva]WPV27163.1 Beta-glucuronidase [Fulvia fulva]
MQPGISCSTTSIWALWQRGIRMVCHSTESAQYRFRMSSTHQNGLPQHGKRTIQVPYVFHAPASGINERGVHQVLWYERRVEDLRSQEEKSEGYRLLLRFGAVDYHAKVWLNGQYVGEHQGGHVPFDLDLTEATLLSGLPLRLTIRVFDSAFHLTQPRGKQYWGPQPESIFYTPSSGVWQSVSLEAVPPARIVDGSYGTILRSTNIERGILDARVCVSGRRVGQPLTIEVQTSIGGVIVGTGRGELPRDEDFIRLSDVNTRLTQQHTQMLPPEFLSAAPQNDSRCWRDGVALWSPECPFLYDVTLRLLGAGDGLLDEVKTTIGMRSLDWTTGDGTFRLNGRPHFQALFLDQGYWPNTLMTPPSSAALKRDIELSKAMGMDGCRKHQKVEDPIFMYWADRLGFLVWGEMASCYHFSVEYMKRFDQEWMEMVKRDINHPSIVTWTPVNESWGYTDLGGDKRQRDHIRSLYYMTKTYDPTRPINDNCGWEHVLTDISSFHDYADGNGMAERSRSLKEIIGRGRPMFLGPIYGKNGIEDEGSRHVQGAPVMCTEFGGVNIAKSNDDSRKGNWGSTTASDAQDLLKRVEGLVMGTVKEGHVCGIVWTQFTDIEQEQNGLYSYDRQEKLPARDVKAVMEKAAQAYLSKRHGR